MGDFVNRGDTMTYTSFFDKYSGKSIDFDNAYGVQCFDLANKYVVDVVGGKPFIGTNAYEIYTKFNNQPSKTLFDRIANTPDFVPKQGDIMVWNTGKNGHVAICTGLGTKQYFTSYDQNWTGNNEGVTPIKHTYSGVLGVLRPKNDVTGYTKNDSTIGTYAVKKLLMLAGAKLDDNPIIGNGSINAINSHLKKWGWGQNGIAGEKFIKKMFIEVKNSVKK